MIWFERSFDYDLIRSIITHPAIYPHMVSDGACAPEEYRPCEDSGISYMLVRDDDELIGMFMLVPQTSVCWEVHSCFLPNGRGRAITAYKAGIQWIWENTPCRKLVGNTPSDNRLALRIAERAGLKVMGVNEKSLSRDGVLIDQVMFGIGA
jgi:RimJ/RimL family protein N-acetyltransferase